MPIDTASIPEIFRTGLIEAIYEAVLQEEKGVKENEPG